MNGDSTLITCETCEHHSDPDPSSPMVRCIFPVPVWIMAFISRIPSEQVKGDVLMKRKIDRSNCLSYKRKV